MTTKQVQEHAGASRQTPLEFNLSCFDRLILILSAHLGRRMHPKEVKVTVKRHGVLPTQSTSLAVQMNSTDQTPALNYLHRKAKTLSEDLSPACGMPFKERRFVQEASTYLKQFWARIFSSCTQLRSNESNSLSKCLVSRSLASSALITCFTHETRCLVVATTCSVSDTPSCRSSPLENPASGLFGTKFPTEIAVVITIHA